MDNGRLELGAVYQPDWDPRPIRVIGFDATVVMYDAWWPHIAAWGFAKRVPSLVAYYRVPTRFLLERAKYVRTEPYSDKERSTHRPDLPFAIAQYEAISWYDDVPSDVVELGNRLGQIEAKERASLTTASVCVCPFGPKDSVKKGTLVEAHNGKSFSELELLLAAWKVQVPHLRDKRLTKGVGLYRLGIDRRVPSYALWGAISPLEVECGGVAA